MKYVYFYRAELDNVIKSGVIRSNSPLDSDDKIRKAMQQVAAEEGVSADMCDFTCLSFLHTVE